MRIDKEKVHILMARKELTVADIANNCGKTRQRISCIMNSLNVSPRTAGMIAKALGVDVTEIVEQ